MNPANLQMLPDSSALTAANHQPQRNILFLVPEECGPSCGPECAHKKFEAVARCMMSEGYVYMAQAGQISVEDDEAGVRHLPLKGEELPHFGTLDMIVVFDDSTLWSKIRSRYPEAQTYLFQGSTPFAVQWDTDIAIAELAEKAV